MTEAIPEKLGIIAGRGAYPRLLAEGARKQGVRQVVAVAFRGETDPGIEKAADQVVWLHVGQLEAMLEAFHKHGISQAVMAGQIAPSNLFHVRLDARALAILARLKDRNARTIFGAIGDELKSIGVELLPAYRFMEDTMPAPGLLSRRAPTERERQDIELGLQAAKATSALEIGQTVVVKEGVILAVEAFEGTDETMLRAGKLGGAGAVVVKVARQGHDMRYDIPVVGLHTLAVLKKIKATVLVIEAHKTILLEREQIIEEADKQNLAFIAVEVEDKEKSKFQVPNSREISNTK
ncbi:MAG: UDP-2,3-diacylglucosamine diphosphatase LpxI [Kiritimatiellae bacterium]|nr:UDP-2,3-diacylglucosamine diphosphatase LpxI [Verrucomicrobiota bacterium]MBU4286006.1 UDP-2,3-diacylglucosamine diphosphatase LpxI [Verrucomicrobiota bacterium]MBU4365942.1 UDP-2,3-diacylglucosamine diphosphatase LpxI [Verrucomicrobiota bacterium]MCG2659181.1 UDP-2,3-diacylglucosamine diphosphatase LpxI [Kiritimatiellia bacterium]